MAKRERIARPLSIAPPNPEEKAIPLTSLLRWIWKHAKAEWVTLGLSALCAAGYSALAGMALVYGRDLVNHLARQKTDAATHFPLALLSLVILGATAVRLLGSCLGALAQTNIKRNLEIACIQKVSGANYYQLACRSTGRLTSAIMSEIPLIAQIPSIIINNFVRAPLTIVAMLCVLLMISPWITGGIFLATPLLLLGYKYFSRHAHFATRRAFQNISRLYDALHEQLGGLRVIFSLGRMNWYADCLSDYSRHIANASRQSAVYTALQQATQDFISGCALLTLLVLMAWRVRTGDFQIGEALAVPGGLAIMIGQFLKVTQGMMHLSKTRGASEQVLALLDLPEAQGGDVFLDGPVETLEWKQVSFNYDNGKMLFVEQDLDLKRGRFYVVTGPSGIGKSTFCDLCLGLIHPTAGRILVNGRPLASFNNASLRGNMAIVEQEPYLLDNTIRHNLQLGEEHYTEADMWEALKLADIDGFVRSLPHQLDDTVGPGGGLLSVGQKQRLAIARALLRRPSLLILDEFSSHLDADSEEQVLQNLRKNAGDRLVLCVTHRPEVNSYATDELELRNTHKQHTLIIAPPRPPTSPSQVPPHA